MKTKFLASGVLACVLTAAHADFDSALTAYEAKDFAVAEAEFRRLAELGDAPSQRNLAAMYARGEHVTVDRVQAWAWAALSAESDAKAVPLRDTLRKHLAEADAARADEQLAALRAKFGPEALRRSLLPIPAEREPDCSVDVRSEAVPIKRVAPEYPRNLAAADVEGKVCLKFYLSRGGEPRAPTILSATAHLAGLPGRPGPEGATDAFSKAALRALKESTFRPPATESLREVPSSYCVTYLLDGMPTQAEVRTVREVERQADAGQARAQYELAGIASRLASTSDLRNKDRRGLVDTAERRYLQSAIGGYAPGQFLVAKKLLTGDRCEKDIDKGVAWLTLAAQQGHADAQYLLASRLRKGDGVAKDPAKAIEWMEAAAKGGHPRARVEIVRHWLLHAPEHRAEALAIALEEPSPNDLGQLEGAALAAALQGDFARAESFQRQVLAIATELEFETQDRRRLLEAFEAQRLPAELAAPGT